MDNIVKYLLIGVFAVIVLYYMATTLQSIVEINTSETLDMTAGTNVSLAQILDTAYVPVLSNATQTCTAANYTYNTTHATLKAAQYCEDGNYTFAYYYQKADTVWDIDFGFIGLLVFLGVGVAILIKLTSGKR